MLKKYISIFMVMASLIVLFSSCDNSGVKKSWAKLYTRTDSFLVPVGDKSFKQLGDGGYILGLIVLNDSEPGALHVLKLDVNGSIIWKKQVDSYTQNEPVAMVTSKNGDILVGQIYGRHDATGTTGIKLIKISGNGDFVWEKFFSYNFYLSHFSLDIDPVNDMIYFLGKKIEVSETYPKNFLLAKIDINGNEIYSKIIISGNENDYFDDNYRNMNFFVKPANDGGCLVVFHNKIIVPSTHGTTGYHPVMVKLSAAGDMVWSRSYTISGGVSAATADDPFQLSGITCTADGYIAVGNIPWINNEHNNHRVVPVFKLKPDGTVLKSAELYVMKQDSTAVSGTAVDCRLARPVSIRATSDGGYAMFGQLSDWSEAGYPFATYESERSSAFIVKFDSLWNISWQKEYKEKAYPYTQVPGDPEGNIISTWVEQNLSAVDFCEVPAGGFTVVGDLFKHALIAPLKDIGNGNSISYVLKTTAKGSVANTEIIIDTIKGKVGSIAVVSADRTSSMENTTASVSDAGGAFSDSLIKAYAY